MLVILQRHLANLTGVQLPQDTHLWPTSFLGVTLDYKLILQIIKAQKSPSGAKLIVTESDRSAFDHLALKNIHLSKVDLSRADLAGFDLSGAELPPSPDLWPRSFACVRIDGTQALQIFRAGWSLAKVDLSGANLAHIDFTGADPSIGVDLSGADLSGASLPASSPGNRHHWWPLSSQPGMRLDRDQVQAILSGRIPRDRNSLAGADLRWLDLRRFDFSNVCLAGTDLSGTNLEEALLITADLRGAKLDGARLAGADLSLAQLGGVDFAGVDLSGVAVKDTGAFSRINLSGCKLPQNPEMWPRSFAGFYINKDQAAVIRQAGRSLDGAIIL